MFSVNWRVTKKVKHVAILSLFRPYFAMLFLSTIIFNVINVGGVFYTGRTDFCINEMNRLHGRMTAREAAMKCELDEECAGFTYHGPKSLWDGHEFQMTFYS